VKEKESKRKRKRKGTNKEETTALQSPKEEKQAEDSGRVAGKFAPVPSSNKDFILWYFAIVTKQAHYFGAVIESSVLD
jgi:hypothetical protein